FQLVLRNVPPRDAGAGSGALQAFQQVGGALGVALVGQIFFSQLAGNFSAGLGPNRAFADAAALSLWYQVISFGLVLLLAFRFKASGKQPGGQGAPVVAEA